ncbi:hypothetical protein RFI_24950 [Reticulomyxa filosa]|uniref:Uncharacterized protein n=1 Tax=Reticulomyxa filosa TaxID=46433 RepID=X6MEY2_RETFI|nr:hypothetical protein RFI_24950 [Reticulomyxa filosa]|eukprot:ETO12429.1 hypothetical protein RFI_24950 [Reticulomyxa filosa]
MTRDVVQTSSLSKDIVVKKNKFIEIKIYDILQSDQTQEKQTKEKICAQNKAAVVKDHANAQPRDPLREYLGDKPPQNKQHEYLAFKSFEFYELIRMLYSAVVDECKKRQCCVLYTWHDGSGGTPKGSKKKPIRKNLNTNNPPKAYEYADLLFPYVEKEFIRLGIIVEKEKFDTYAKIGRKDLIDWKYSKTLKSELSDVLRRMFRFLGHTCDNHIEFLRKLDMDRHFNTIVLEFYDFLDSYFVKDKELSQHNRQEMQETLDLFQNFRNKPEIISNVRNESFKREGGGGGIFNYFDSKKKYIYIYIYVYDIHTDECNKMQDALDRRLLRNAKILELTQGLDRQIQSNILVNSYRGFCFFMDDVECVMGWKCLPRLLKRWLVKNLEPITNNADSNGNNNGNMVGNINGNGVTDPNNNVNNLSINTNLNANNNARYAKVIAQLPKRNFWLDVSKAVAFVHECIITQAEPKAVSERLQLILLSTREKTGTKEETRANTEIRFRRDVVQTLINDYLEHFGNVKIVELLKQKNFIRNLKKKHKAKMTENSDIHVFLTYCEFVENNNRTTVYHKMMFLLNNVV